jgi:hypothetical protein
MAKPLVEVAIGADGSVFVREVDKATAASAAFGASVKKSGDAAKQTGKDIDSFAADFGKAAKYVAASAAAAAAGSVLFIKSAIDSADAAGILAGKLDISTESLSKLQYAAQLADVSQGALEGGLKKLAVTLNSALDPGSKVAKVFDALGLSAKELIEIPADQQLGRIGDALNSVANANQRAAVAQMLFGKRGQELLPILAEGTAGIKKSGDELERFGGVISGDLAARAGEFNDNLDRIKTAAGGLGLSVADQLLGPLNDLSNQILELAQQKETAEGIASFIRGIGSAVVFTVETIANTGNVFRFLGEEIAALVGGPAIGDIERIDQAIATLKERLKPDSNVGAGLNVAGVRALMMSDEDRAKILQDIARLEQMKAVSEELVQSQVRAQLAAKQAADAKAEDGAAAAGSTGQNKQLKLSVDALAGALAAETPQQKAETAAREAATRASADARKGLDELIQSKRIENALLGVSARDQARYRAQLQLTEIAARGNVEVTDAMRQEMDALTISTYDTTEATKAHEQAMADAAKASNPWAEALQGAVERVDSAFVDMWKNIGSGFDSFADSLKDAFKQLLAELANLAITRPIMMRIGAALGLGGGSAGAMASGGGFGGIGSLLGGAKSFIGGFKSGGLSGGLDALFGGAGSGLSSGLASAYGGLGDLFGAVGLDRMQLLANGKGLAYGSASFGQSLTNLGLDAGAGLIGGFAGNKLGQALFGDRKTTGIGSTVGGIAGSVFGPLGTGVGAFLGSIAENAIGKIFGLGDQAKWGKLGIQTGKDLPTDGSALQTITAASGLTLTAIAKRTDDQAAKQLLEGFSAIDSALTDAARAAGVTVDFTNTVLGRKSADVNGGGEKNFFGSAGRLDNFTEEGIKNSADQFARQWINEIDDQLSTRIKRILGDKSNRTAEQIVQLFGFATKLDELLKLDVLKEVADAAAASTKTLLDAYSEATDAVVNLAQEYDGTLESMTGLTDALTSQKQVAAQLAAAYQEVSSLVDATFGNAISTIEESMLSEADLYQRRREQIASLTAELGTTIDPAKIAGLVQQIDSLAGSAFQMLDESQRASLSGEFIDFLRQAQTLADQQIQAGRDSLAGRETAVTNAVDLEVMNTAALTQQAAANTFSEAVEKFAGIVGGNAFGIDIETIIANLKNAGVEVPG